MTSGSSCRRPLSVRADGTTAKYQRCAPIYVYTPMDTDSDECLFDYTPRSRSSDWSSQSDTEESKDSDMMDYEYEIKIMDVEMSDSDAEDADTSVAMDIDMDLDMDENDDYDSPTVEMTDAVDIVITMDYETLDSMEGVRYGEL